MEIDARREWMPDLSAHPLVRRVKKVLAVFLEPAAAIQEQDQRRQIQFLSALTLFMVAESWLWARDFTLDPSSQRYAADSFGNGFVFLALYMVSRTSHARLAVWLLFPVLHIVVFLFVFPHKDHQSLSFLVFLTIPVLLSTLFLTTWQTVVNALVAGGLVMAYFYSRGVPVAAQMMPRSFVPITSGMIVFIAYYRNILERDRRDHLLRAFEQQAASEKMLEQANHRLRVEQLQGRAALLEQRNHMAREMHDGLAQSFLGIIFQIDAALGLLPVPAPAVREHLERARQWARRGSDEAREAIATLRSSVTRTSALVEQLRRHAAMLKREGEMEIEIGEAREAPLTARVGGALLRVGQEALTNALRHGHPRHVRVEVEPTGEAVVLRVQDDGIGFSPDKIAGTPGFGILGMRERMEVLGGRLSVDSNPGAGTTVLATAPVEKSPEGSEGSGAR